jgi:hypothetical protein
VSAIARVGPAALTLAFLAGATAIAQPAVAVDFSRLRGFNLLGKFHAEWSNQGYVEEDFRLVHDFGFNFVRLPIDYRTYTLPGSLLAFDETSLAQIDQAVTWGRQYGIHVCINLHRGPGYTVASPPEPLSLWTDPTMQAAFQAHWEMFAARYAEIPAEALSFNLLNEPSGVSDETYGAVMRPVIEAIRRHDPDRPIVSDGLEYCARPAQSLRDLGIVQAARGYHPFQLTHYQAEWVEGAESWAVPAWPPAEPALASYFYGDGKAEYQSSFELRHDLEAGAVLGIDVHQVSSHMELAVRADETPVWSHTFAPGPGSGEWSEVVFAPQWGIYQNIYDRTYEVTLERSARRIVIVPGRGDWLTINALTLRNGASSYTFRPNIVDWGARQTAATIGADGNLVPAVPTGITGESVLREYLEPWLAYRDAGGAIFVGEMGAYNRTPHPVTLAWLRDLLDLYAAEGLGWAVWNLRGSFGVLDSGRADVTYEPYAGHQLDAAMLGLLQNNP